MPTKHPSAWRLNKAEEKSVEADLAAWEARQSPDTSPEELALKRSEERKRLVRVIQEAKHKASLEKQSGVAAKTKLSAKTTRSGMTIPDAADSSPPCNGEYYEALKQDLAVIEKALGSKLKEMMPTPIATAIGEKTGVQDSHLIN